MTALVIGTPFRPQKATQPDPASLPDLLVMGDLERSRRLDQMMEKGLVASALVPREDALMEDATGAAQLLDRDYELLSGPSRPGSSRPSHPIPAKEHKDEDGWRLCRRKVTGE